MRLSLFIFFVNLLWIFPALAAPSLLHNKTVTLEWTVSSVQRDAAGNEIHPVTSIRYVIYVSTAGRLFERSSRSVGKRAGVSDSEPGAPSNGMGEARGLSFSGNNMLVNRGYGGAGGSGAMQAVASFDRSFSNCTLSVMHGKEKGAVIKRRMLDGVVRQIISMQVSNPTCSVQNGNAFAH